MLDLTYYETNGERGEPIYRRDGIRVDWIHKTRNRYVYGYVDEDGLDHYSVVEETGRFHNDGEESYSDLIQHQYEWANLYVNGPSPYWFESRSLLEKDPSRARGHLIGYLPRAKNPTQASDYTIIDLDGNEV